MRGETIVQCNGVILVFDDDARTDFRDFIESRFERRIEIDARVPFDVIVIHPDLRAVPADRGQFERRKDAVDVFERPAADERDRAIELAAKALQRLPQIFRNEDFLRPRRDVEQGAVHVEHDRDIVEDTQRIGGERFGMCGGRRLASIDGIFRDPFRAGFFRRLFWWPAS